MSEIFSEDEKARIRFHLGYPNVTTLSSASIGMIRPMQTAFLLEASWTVIVPSAADLVREQLCNCESIFKQMAEARKRLRISSAEGVKFNNGELEALKEEYRYFAGTLADCFGVPLYKFSERFTGGGVLAGNISSSD